MPFLKQRLWNIHHNRSIYQRTYKSYIPLQLNWINPSNGNGSEDGLSLAQRALKNKRRRKVISDEYSCLTFVLPTSNAVEWLFSNARLVLTDYHKSMTPYTFEDVMFLNLIGSFGI